MRVFSVFRLTKKRKLVAVLTAILGGAVVAAHAEGILAGSALVGRHAADPSNPVDAAILHAVGDTVAGRLIRNSCGGGVRPMIVLPAPATAVIMEMDTSGLCSGSDPPGSLTVLVQAGSTWRVSTSTTGTDFRLGPVRNGRPDIIVQYAPTQRDCPVLSWNGTPSPTHKKKRRQALFSAYEDHAACALGRSRDTQWAPHNSIASRRFRNNSPRL